MKKIIISALVFGGLLSASLAFAAPTSTIVQNLFITGLNASGTPCLYLAANNLVSTATSTCSGSASPASTTIITGINGVTVTQVGVNATASLDTTYPAIWTALESFSKGIAVNGNVKLSSTTGAILLTDSSGNVVGFGGGSCSAGNAVQMISAVGTVTCAPFLTGNQTITLTGPVTGSGATSITTSITSPLNVSAINATTITATTSISINGVSVATSTGIAAGSCTNCNLSYNPSGLITAAANGTGGGGGVTTSSPGVANTLPIWTSASALGNSIVTQNVAGSQVRVSSTPAASASSSLFLLGNSQLATGTVNLPNSTSGTYLAISAPNANADLVNIQAGGNAVMKITGSGSTTFLGPVTVSNDGRTTASGDTGLLDVFEGLPTSQQVLFDIGSSNANNQFEVKDNTPISFGLGITGISWTLDNLAQFATNQVSGQFLDMFDLNQGVTLQSGAFGPITFQTGGNSGTLTNSIMALNGNTGFGVATSSQVNSRLTVTGTVQFNGSSTLVTPSLGGALTLGTCDTVTSTVDLTYSSATTEFASQYRIPEGGLVQPAQSYLTAPGVLTTYMCGLGIVTPTSTPVLVKIIK